jgi:hypothetical protein
MMQTSLSSSALDISRYWQEIWMLNIHLVVSNTSDAKLLNLLHINEFEISAPQCPTDYSPTGNVTCSILLCTRISGRQKSLSLTFWNQITYLPVIFNVLDHISTRNLSGPVDKLADWERFQSLASEIISPVIQINSDWRSR